MNTVNNKRNLKDIVYSYLKFLLGATNVPRGPLNCNINFS